MTVLDRFIKYVAFDTQSDETTGVTPSTPGQRVFAKALVSEMKEMGLEEITLDEHGYVMATLPANGANMVPTIGFIAHMDTSPDACGKDIRPRKILYQGGDIVLNEEEKVVLSPEKFPELNDYVGQELIVTDGRTLLGADDKAGIAAILGAMDYLIKRKDIKHGKIRVAFTPDEEIGEGADHFDVAKFGCDWAYTIDGGAIGELEYENFNAATAQLTFRGLNVHPGYAKDKMVNAAARAAEFASWLPTNETPEHTEGYEGFFHLIAISGSVEEAMLGYLIRDHSHTRFEERKALLRTLVAKMNQLYPDCVELELKDQYYNMKEILVEKKYIVELAAEAMRQVGIEPKVMPVRGGTDGARLSFMGLPCPNLFAGGLNFHGRYEFLPIRSLEKSMETIIQIIELNAQQKH